MQNLAVIVATTAGPVVIERITPESAPQSMMCLGRSSDVLSVSGEYDDFVRHGSGVILREFGQEGDRSYRLDASGIIDGGQSWQLGVFLAHAIAANADCTLCAPDEADAVIWCSGTVDYDLNIGAVSHIPHKVATSAELLQNLTTPLYAVLCAENMAEADTLPPQTRRITASTTAEALTNLPMVSPSTALTVPPDLPIPPESQPPRKSFPLWSMVGAGAVIAALAFLILPKDDTPTASKPLPAPPQASTPLPAEPAVLPDPIPAPQPAPKPASPSQAVSLTNARGNTGYAIGESLSLRLSLQKDAWVYCYYRSSDGSTVQILPNPVFTKKGKSPRLKGHTSYDLPGDDLFPFDLKASAPAGTDTLTCFAANKDPRPYLPTALTGTGYDPLPPELANGLPMIFQNLPGISSQTTQLKIKIRK